MVFKIYTSLILSLITFSSFATIFVPVSIRKQIQESSAIVKGVIESSSVKKINNHIVTEYLVKAQEYAGINSENGLVKFIQPGGVFNGQGTMISGTVDFKNGEEIFVILKSSTEGFWLQSLGLGKYVPFKENNKTFYKSVIFPKHPELGKISEESLQTITKEKFRFTVKNENNNEQNKIQHQAIYELKPHVKRKIASTNPEKENYFPFFMGGIGLLFILGMWLLKDKEENE